MLKLKLQYFGHLIRRADSPEKTLILGQIEGRRRRGQQRMRWLNSITKSKDMNLSKLQEIVKNMGTCCAAVQGSQKVGCDLATEQQQHPLSSNSLINNEEPVVLKFFLKIFPPFFF